MTHSPTDGFVHPDAVPDHGLILLASGIDSLTFSGKATLSASLLERLGDGRSAAQEAGEPVPFIFGGSEFLLAPHGFGRYPFSLTHEHGQIGVTGSQNLPAFRVQLRAGFIHGIGAEAAAQAFVDLLERVAGPIETVVSRVDLFADFMGWALVAEDRHRFVTRAVITDLVEVYGQVGTLQFGRRKGGGLSARIYNKPLEMAKKGSTWLLEEWGDQYVPGEQVWRVEFEFGRTVLRNRGIDTLDDLFANIGGLWAYGTEWLSFRDRTADQTRSRWPIAPEWTAVSNIPLRGSAIGLEKVSRSKREAALRTVRNGLRGYAISYAALTGIRDVDEMGRCLTAQLLEHEKVSGNPFAAHVERRCRQKGWNE